MADTIVPHFHNDPGVPVIEIGAQRFMCVGAKPPFDHPHVFLDMGDDKEIICPYCSTLYRHDPALDAARGAAGRMRADRDGRSLSRGAQRRGASRNIIIAGGGIGGLTAALALARAGFRAIVLEQADAPGRDRRRHPALAQRHAHPDRARAWRAAAPRRCRARQASACQGRDRQARLARIPLGDDAEQRYGAPYWVHSSRRSAGRAARRGARQPRHHARLGTRVEDFVAARSTASAPPAGRPPAPPTSKASR